MHNIKNITGKFRKTELAKRFLAIVLIMAFILQIAPPMTFAKHEGVITEPIVVEETKGGFTTKRTVTKIPGTSHDYNVEVDVTAEDIELPGYDIFMTIQDGSGNGINPDGTPAGGPNGAFAQNAAFITKFINDYPESSNTRLSFAIDHWQEDLGCFYMFSEGWYTMDAAGKSSAIARVNDALSPGGDHDDGQQHKTDYTTTYYIDQTKSRYFDQTRADAEKILIMNERIDNGRPVSDQNSGLRSMDVYEAWADQIITLDGTTTNEWGPHGGVYENTLGYYTYLSAADAAEALEAISYATSPIITINEQWDASRIEYLTIPDDATKSLDQILTVSAEAKDCHINYSYKMRIKDNIEGMLPATLNIAPLSCEFADPNYTSENQTFDGIKLTEHPIVAVDTLDIGLNELSTKTIAGNVVSVIDPSETITYDYSGDEVLRDAKVELVFPLNSGKAPVDLGTNFSGSINLQARYGSFVPRDAMAIRVSGYAVDCLCPVVKTSPLFATMSSYDQPHTIVDTEGAFTIKRTITKIPGTCHDYKIDVEVESALDVPLPQYDIFIQIQDGTYKGYEEYEMNARFATEFIKRYPESSNTRLCVLSDHWGWLDSNRSGYNFHDPNLYPGYNNVWTCACVFLNLPWTKMDATGKVFAAQNMADGTAFKFHSQQTPTLWKHYEILDRLSKSTDPSRKKILIYNTPMVVNYDLPAMLAWADQAIELTGEKRPSISTNPATGQREIFTVLDTKDAIFALEEIQYATNPTIDLIETFNTDQVEILTTPTEGTLVGDKMTITAEARGFNQAYSYNVRVKDHEGMLPADIEVADMDIEFSDPDLYVQNQTANALTIHEDPCAPEDTFEFEPDGRKHADVEIDGDIVDVPLYTVNDVLDYNYEGDLPLRDEKVELYFPNSPDKDSILLSNDVQAGQVNFREIFPDGDYPDEPMALKFTAYCAYHAPCNCPVYRYSDPFMLGKGTLTIECRDQYNSIIPFTGMESITKFAGEDYTVTQPKVSNWYEFDRVYAQLTDEITTFDPATLGGMMGLVEEGKIVFKYKNRAKVSIVWEDELGNSLPITKKFITSIEGYADDSFDIYAEDLDWYHYKKVNLDDFTGKFNAKGLWGQFVSFDNGTIVMIYQGEGLINIEWVDELGNPINVPGLQTSIYADRGASYKLLPDEIDGYQFIESRLSDDFSAEYDAKTGNGVMGFMECGTITMVYRPAAAVDVFFIDQDGNDITPTGAITRIDGWRGDSFTSNWVEIPGYEFVGTKLNLRGGTEFANGEGVFGTDNSQIVYEYRRLANLVVKYVDEDGNDIADGFGYRGYKYDMVDVPYLDIEGYYYIGCYLATESDTIYDLDAQVVTLDSGNSTLYVIYAQPVPPVKTGHQSVQTVLILLCIASILLVLSFKKRRTA